MMTRTRPVTHPSTDANAPWAIEVDRGPDAPPEYYPIQGMKLLGGDLVIATPGGDQVRFKNKKIRKILVMRTTEVSTAEAGA